MHTTSNLRRQNQQYFANRSLPGLHGNNLLSVRGVPLKTGHDQYLPMLPEAESQRNAGHIGMEATQKRVHHLGRNLTMNPPSSALTAEQCKRNLSWDTCKWSHG